MKMKKILLLLTVLLTVTVQAQDRVVERTYLTTDRDVYVAGETLWYSAFCLDVAKGTLSRVSSVAYVELHDAEKMVASGKVALLDGRGAGQLSIPGSLPTGNYRLVVYTAQNRAERGYDFNGLASKTVSIFNVFSGERVKDGVELVEPEAYEEYRIGSGVTKGDVTLAVAGDSLVLVNRGGEAATLSLSVTHDDGFAANGNPTISDFTAEARRVGPKSFDNSILPEYEGEIIHGHITGFSEEMMPKLMGKFAFISTPSTKSDVYSSVIDPDGKVAFFTGNIYGTKEYICEIEGIDPSLNCFIELESPFVNAQVAAPKKLRMSESLREPLLARSVAMQIERHFTSDTLLDPLSVRQCGLFGSHEVVYVLDDYTRFTTMEEVLIEFVSEMRARRRSDGSRDIQIRLDNGTLPFFSSMPTLMLLDGVPVFDQQKIMDYDPLLVESIHIYPQTYYIGSRSYEGIANFITYKHNLPGFQFGGNVRVVDFQGVSWPTSYTGQALRDEEGYPDYRQTIYWHPLLTLAPGQTLVIPCKMPDYTGRFKVSMEGLSTAGTPFHAETSFSSK
jgi:hypothetical protein